LLLALLEPLNVLGGSPQKCTGTPPMYQGRACASTTRYTDSTMGACGCGSTGNNNPFTWETNFYTAAPSQALFDYNNPGNSWCGPGCGKCYLLTPTGGYITGEGSAPSSLNPIVVMVGDLCPNAGNSVWCPNPGGTDQFGYPVHFDLRNNNGQIDAIGWDNPEVTYAEVACSCGNSLTPTNGDWAQCQCFPGSGNSTGACDGSTGSGSGSGSASGGASGSGSASGGGSSSSASTLSTILDVLFG